MKGIGKIGGILIGLFGFHVMLYGMDGEALFKANCAACHKIESKLVGPALKGVHERWQNNTEELIAFIRNSQSYLKSDRPMADYARKVFEENNKLVMTAFENLSEEEIKAILDYIKAAGSGGSASVSASEQGGAVSSPVETNPTYDPTQLSHNLLITISIFSAIVGLLTIALVILVAKIIK